MLTICPEKDKLFSKNILNRCGADGENPAVLTAKENEKLLGYVALDLKDYAVRILEFSITGRDILTDLNVQERQLADSMIKAAASFGMNRSVYLMNSGYQPAFELLSGFGFRQYDNKMRIDYAQLIKKCKRC